MIFSFFSVSGFALPRTLHFVDHLSDVLIFSVSIRTSLCPSPPYYLLKLSALDIEFL